MLTDHHYLRHSSILEPPNHPLTGGPQAHRPASDFSKKNGGPLEVIFLSNFHQKQASELLLMGGSPQVQFRENNNPP